MRLRLRFIKVTEFYKALLFCGAYRKLRLPGRKSPPELFEFKAFRLKQEGKKKKNRGDFVSDDEGKTVMTLQRRLKSHDY